VTSIWSFAGVLIREPGLVIDGQIARVRDSPSKGFKLAEPGIPNIFGEESFCVGWIRSCDALTQT